jgi:hypothetical protein
MPGSGQKLRKHWRPPELPQAANSPPIKTTINILLILRAPPIGWEDTVLRLAKKRLSHYQRLVVEMDKVVSAAVNI